MFKLYYAPGTCARASHIALEEAGASYTAERLDFKNSQQTTPQYLAINPKGRVPALVTDRGTLTETPAILAFIAQSFPQARLMPDDPFAFAQAQSFPQLHLPPLSRMDCAAASILSGERERIVTAAPACASRVAICRLMPLDAPATKAVLPARRLS